MEKVAKRKLSKGEGKTDSQELNDKSTKVFMTICVLTSASRRRRGVVLHDSSHVEVFFLTDSFSFARFTV